MVKDFNNIIGPTGGISKLLDYQQPEQFCKDKQL